MDLDTYLRENSIDGASFADAIGMTEASLSRIRRGQQNITRDTIRKIVEATNGVVTLESLVFPTKFELMRGHHADSDTANPEQSPTGQSSEMSGEFRAAGEAA